MKRTVVCACMATLMMFVSCAGIGGDNPNDSVITPENGSNSSNGNTNPPSNGNDIEPTVVYENALLGTIEEQTENAITVRTRSELLQALKDCTTTGGLIYIDGMIDMSNEMMPSVGGNSTAKLDAFVKEQTTKLFEAGDTRTDRVFETYKDFVEAYSANCNVASDDKKRETAASKYGKLLWALSDEYSKIIKVAIPSNTTIVGVSAGSGLKGAAIKIGKVNNVAVSNIVVKNLIIQDAYDPFPHHEKNDGFNSQHDGICIQDGAHDVWVDHCTFKDTMTIAHVVVKNNADSATADVDEKWQTYDGLLDMKSKDTTNITVSYCRFENHDKTMLIGSSDTEWDGCHRKVVLHHNYFYNCGQRLPMIRQTMLHAFNNYYDADENGVYTQQYAIGIRNKCKAVCENNYFGKGINYSYNGTSDASIQGDVYSSGDFDESKNKKAEGMFRAASEKTFDIDYEYNLLSAEEVPAFVKKHAGAGVISVK